jgi:ribosomal protein L37E
MNKRGETCPDCGTRYNVVANDECPYCDFPDLPEMEMR